MTDLIYLYDGSFDGFLCCIFARYAKKEIPTAIICDEDFTPTLFDVRRIETDASQAGRVWRRLRQLSPEAAGLLRRGFLTCMPERELCLYRVAEKLLEEGPGFLRDPADETLYPVRKGLRFLGTELEKLRGFVRFSDFGGVLGSEIRPKNRVLPLLRRHFCERFQNETFFIYDRTHREALFYAAGRWAIVPVGSFEMAGPDETEARYRRLWKRFYDTVAIRERENPRCQDTQMPKWYRESMTEFQGPEHFRAASPDPALTGRRSPAAGQGPAFPAGRSAPGTRPLPGPPAPGSSP